MRLLNSKTFEWKWTFNPDQEHYWVLSHLWIDDEITLQKFEQSRTDPSASKLAGVQKVLRFCKEASRAGVEWVWVDTCCIDKTNSLELSEALNSMWEWYRSAEMCIIYLEDVHLEGPTGLILDWHQDFKNSRWFTRGWTLQELIAPRQARFVDAKWRDLGMRSDLLEMLEKVTLIRSTYYGDVAQIRAATVAERMSWMRKRNTKREEDRAYCMLGIFGVNMPMLYGEGSRAFMRLQEQIINTTDDETIFAWRVPLGKKREPGGGGGPCGLLATSPNHFLSPRVYQLRNHNFFFRGPYRMTNKGVELEVYGKIRTVTAGETMLVPLNVVYNDIDTDEEKRLQIRLVAQADGTWLREDASNLSEARSCDVPVPESERSKRSRTWEKIARSDGDFISFWRSEFLDHETQFKIYIRQP